MRSFDIEKTVKRFGGLEPYQIPDYKALAGDKSDNLPGVPGTRSTACASPFAAIKNTEHRLHITFWGKYERGTQLAHQVRGS